MEFVNEDLQIFVDLGLTLLQAKVYISLVETGKATAKNISQVSKVSRPDVYRTIYRLQELGLIEQEIARPTVYRAIPTTTALEVLLENRTMKHNELKSKANCLIDRLGNNNKVTVPKKESKFVLVPSKEVLINKLKTAIGRAQKCIDVATSCKRLKFACYSLSEALNEAWLRGVRGRAVIEETGEKEVEIMEDSWRKPSAELRYVPKIPRTVMAMYDKKEVFIFTVPEADLKESPALWSNDPSLLCMAEDYFELLWTKSLGLTKIKTRRIGELDNGQNS